MTPCLCTDSSDEYECLYFNQLPFAGKIESYDIVRISDEILIIPQFLSEDVRDFSFNSFDSVQISTGNIVPGSFCTYRPLIFVNWSVEQLTAAESLVDSLDLTKSSFDPETIFNPVLQRFNQFVKVRSAWLRMFV